MGVAMIVRCVDNTLQRGVLVLGREYEVRAERDDCYILSGFDKEFSKTRFEIVSIGPCQLQRRGDQPSRDTLFNDDFRATAFGANQPLF
jgi:hypothetical protein